MPRRSAGLLLYRIPPDEHDVGPQVLLGHMGGPLWARRDTGAWSIPKGEYTAEEEPLTAARREFAEELGLPAPPGPYEPLGEARQSGGKVVTIWAVAAALDPDTVRPGTFTMEWPPRSGESAVFPELDRVAWFTLSEAAERVARGQRVFLERLRARLAG